MNGDNVRGVVLNESASLSSYLLVKRTKGNVHLRKFNEKQDKYHSNTKNLLDFFLLIYLFIYCTYDLNVIELFKVNNCETVTEVIV